MTETEYRQRTTFEEFVAQAQPLSWGTRSEMKLEKWFEWPPDVFALSSLLLSYTGAYRRAAGPPENHHWPEEGWNKAAHDKATQWRNWVSTGMKGTHPLSGYLKRLEDHKSLEIDRLYDPPEGEPWKLFVTLLEVHSIADEAMRGVGSVFSPGVTLGIVESQTEIDVGSEGLSLFYLQANFLLALRGSLSRLPKYRGVVLPKARTPQIGLTLRSFSNNLTFHQTEVDVVWRTFPWFNSDENTVNLLIVPWPFKVEARFFRPVSHPRAASQLGEDRYFHYKPQPSKGLNVGALVKVIEESEADVRRVHALVFPEMAFTPGELKALKNELEKKLSPQHIPMIVSGTSEELKKDDSDESDAATESELQERRHWRPGPQAKGYNRVVLSVYYAGRWHDVGQDKHHRWKLDSQQIEQYRLGGVLSGVRNWWESIHVFRRRLSVLSANPWLTICPLICEDLARLDPVSELVRGVGPTLLIALLLDGPQLKQRWSARYASVFADDPGSSVLAVTSLGMSLRSVIPGDVSEEATKKARESAPVVGQWKDQEGNWYPVRVNNVEEPVKLLTLGARWESEAAFDGRLDRDSSAVFVYQGMEDYELERDEDGTQEVVIEEPPGRGEDARKKKLQTLDMCELTLFTFYVDALVDVSTVEDADRLFAWFVEAVDCTHLCPAVEAPADQSELQQELIELLVDSIGTRDLLPRELPTPHLILAIQRVTDFVRHALNDAPPNRFLGFWKVLKNRAMEGMEKVHDRMSVDLERLERDTEDRERCGCSFSDDLAETVSELQRRADAGEGKSTVQITDREVGRILFMFPLAVLWAIHSRLSTRRRFGVLTSDEAGLLEEIEEIVDKKDYHQTHIRWRDAKRSEEKAEIERGQKEAE